MNGTPPTKEEQGALLSALCRAVITLDQPKDLTDLERAVLEDFTNTVARTHGFDDWITALHATSPARDGQPAPRPRRHPAYVAIMQVAEEMRNRRVNNGRHESATLVAWADRLEKAISAGPVRPVNEPAEEWSWLCRRYDAAKASACRRILEDLGLGEAEGDHLMPLEYSVRQAMAKEKANG